MNINGNNNISIDGSNNEVNITQDAKPKLKLEEINERFRNYSVDFFTGILTLFATIIASGQGGLGVYALIVPVVVALIYFIYLPKKYPLMYIYVYNDKFKYLLDKEIQYSDIKNFGYKNNGFYWRLSSPKEKSLTLYNKQNSFFIYDCIDRYSIATGTKLY